MYHCIYVPEYLYYTLILYPVFTVLRYHHHFVIGIFLCILYPCQCSRVVAAAMVQYSRVICVVTASIGSSWRFPPGANNYFHMSYAQVTRYMSHVTYHLSHFTCQKYFFWGQSDEAITTIVGGESEHTPSSLDSIYHCDLLVWFGLVRLWPIPRRFVLRAAHWLLTSPVD